MEGFLVGVYPPNLDRSALRYLHELLMQNNERARRFCLWLDGVIVNEMQRRVREDNGFFVETQLPAIDLEEWSDQDIGAGLVVAVVLTDAVDDLSVADLMKRLVFLFSVEARARLGG